MWAVKFDDGLFLHEDWRSLKKDTPFIYKTKPARRELINFLRERECLDNNFKIVEIKTIEEEFSFEKINPKELSFKDFHKDACALSINPYGYLVFSNESEDECAAKNQISFNPEMVEELIKVLKDYLEKGIF